MSNDIRIKKGLDIKLVGEAALTKSDAIKSNFYSIKPEDFHGLTPKLLVKAGAKVQAGEPIFYDKSNESIQFVSPVSGEIVEILRGEKRRILEVKIQADKPKHFWTTKNLKLKVPRLKKLKPNYLLQDAGHLSCNVPMTSLQIQRIHQKEFLFLPMLLRL